MCLHVCVYHWFWKCLLIVYCVFNYLYISLPHISYVKSLIAEAFTMQFDILQNNFVNCTCKHAVTPHKDSLVKGLLLYLPIHITYSQLEWETSTVTPDLPRPLESDKLWWLLVFCGMEQKQNLICSWNSSNWQNFRTHLHVCRLKFCEITTISVPTVNSLVATFFLKIPGLNVSFSSLKL